MGILLAIILIPATIIWVLVHTFVIIALITILFSGEFKFLVIENAKRARILRRIK